MIGLAQLYDQEGEYKPDPRTPVEGLYLVGCDAGGRGVGTEQALLREFQHLDRVLDDVAVAVQPGCAFTTPDLD